MATDLAEFVGAAIGLNLLFHVPLLAAGLITAVVAFGQGGDTHDRGTVRKETAAAFPDKPDKRHVYPHNYKDDSTEVLVADRAFFGSRRLLDWVPRFSRWW